LLSCEDESLRDPSRALSLAKSIVKDVPERGEAWLTLALASYRNGHWQSADAAMQEAFKRGARPESAAEEAALMAMIRWRQKRLNDARTWLTKSCRESIESKVNDEALLVLRAEAIKLIGHASLD
jgi:uncharacterized protein HemY